MGQETGAEINGRWNVIHGHTRRVRRRVGRGHFFNCDVNRIDGSIDRAIFVVRIGVQSREVKHAGRQIQHRVRLTVTPDNRDLVSLRDIRELTAEFDFRTLVDRVHVDAERRDIEHRIVDECHIRIIAVVPDHRLDVHQGG